MNFWTFLAIIIVAYYVYMIFRAKYKATRAGAEARIAEANARIAEATGVPVPQEPDRFVIE
jgi:branched-subunit amino acid ABC-type transport system permease component